MSLPLISFTRIPGLVVLGLLVAAPAQLPAGVAGPTPLRVRVEVPPAHLQWQPHGTWSLPQLRDGVPGPTGDPWIPRLPVTVALPAGTEVDRVELVALETHGAGTHRVPARPGTGPGAIAGPEAWRPSAHAGADTPTWGTAYARGNPVGLVVVDPLRWDPATGAVTLLTRFDVVVHLRSAPEDPGRLRPERPGTEDLAVWGRPAWASLDRIGVHPRHPRPRVFAPRINSGAPFAPTFRPSLEGSAVDMVIVTAPGQVAEYQRLADHHTRAGLPTVVRTIDWIEANYPRGVDRAETVRNFLRDAVARWGTTYALLGGDVEIVPVRYTFTGLAGGHIIPTEFYYADLDGTWNADGDAIFGEGQGDQVDLFPDLWLGRIPSANPAQAAVMVDKTLAYLTDPPAGFVNRHLYLAEVLFPENWVAGTPVYTDGADLAEGIIELDRPQHEAVRLYENHTAWPGSLPEEIGTVLDSINAGFNLVHHVGHGFVNTMSVGIDGETLDNSEIVGLQNGNRGGLLYAVNCTSCAIDRNSIGEEWLRNPNGGAVCAVGSSTLDFVVESNLLQDEFYDVLFGDDVTEPARALSLARNRYVGISGTDNTMRWTLFAQLYLGDPALWFWMDEPGELTVSHAGSVPLGANAYPVTVERTGLPVEGARVTFFKEDDTYASALTDASGQVTLPIRPDLVGPFSLAATTPDDLPWFDEGTVIAPAGPYLFARDQLIQDLLGSGIGNGNGRMEAGETIELAWRAGNGGGAVATNVTATLTVESPWITVLDPESEWPQVQPGGDPVSYGTMLLHVDPGTPDGTEIDGELVWSFDQGGSVETVRFYVHASGLELYALTVRDTVGNGDGDGVPEADEDIVLLPAIRNTGLADVQNPELRLRSTDPTVTLTDTVALLTNLGSGSLSVPQGDGLQLRMEDPAAAAVDLVLRDMHGAETVWPLDFVLPDTVSAPFAVGSASSIALQWVPVGGADLAGYAVYRASDPGGPFTRVNAWLAASSSIWVDYDLPALTPFFYRVAAVDRSGNRGPFSPVAAATTTLPLHTGWPVAVPNLTTGGATAGDLDGDGALEVLSGGDEILAFTPDGVDFADGDGNLQTAGPLSATGGAQIWNVPAVGDLDGDGDGEAVATTWLDARVHAVDHTGQPLPGWPRSADPDQLPSPNAIGSVTLADLDRDGDLEILAVVGRYVFAWHHDGTEVTDGDADPGTDGVFAATANNFSYCTPAVGNIDEEPFPEVVVAMRDGGLYVYEHTGAPYPGFPFVTGDNLATSPTLGDIDDDGRVEIVFPASDGNLYAIRADGTVATGFPRTYAFEQDWDAPAALVDLTGDGGIEVVTVTSDGELLALHGASGLPIPGFPVILADANGPVPSRCPPVVADVDGDGGRDIVVGDSRGRLHAFRADGTALPGFPIATGNQVETAAVVWDLDGDGLTEIALQSTDQRLYVWDSPWSFDPLEAPWPMHQRNPRHTGSLDDGFFVAVDVPSGAGPQRVRLLPALPNPTRAGAAIGYVLPDGDDVAVTLQVFDARGRRVRTLVRSEQQPGAHRAQWDGRDDRGMDVAGGLYFYRLQAGATRLSRKLVILR